LSRKSGIEFLQLIYSFGIELKFAGNQDKTLWLKNLRSE